MVTILSLTQSKTWGTETGIGANKRIRHSVKISVLNGDANVNNSASILSSVMYGGERFSVNADLESLCGGVYVKDDAGQPNYEATLEKVAEKWVGQKSADLFCLTLKLSEIFPDSNVYSLTLGTDMTASTVRRVVARGTSEEDARANAIALQRQTILGRCQRETNPYTLKDAQGNAIDARTLM